MSIYAPHPIKVSFLGKIRWIMGEDPKFCFEKRKIYVRHGVDRLIHREIGLSDSEFPNAVSSYKKTLSIPIYPSLALNDAKKVTSVFKELL